MRDAYIFDGLRSPFGRHAGALAGIRPDDLAAAVMQAVIAQNGIDPARIEDVILGNVCQSGEDSRNIARFAALLAGLPESVPGLTVNRLCGSGLAAVMDAARCVACGQGDLFLAGGVESMTRAPLVMGKAATPWARDARIWDSTIGARLPNPALRGGHALDPMPRTADAVAADLGISRAASDRYAHASQQRFEAARAAIAAELTPIAIAQRKGDPVVVRADEHPRPDTTLDRMAALRPLEEGGVVTAASASGINDGAAVLAIGAAGAGPQPRGRILGAAVAGVAPRVMGLGPTAAIPKALARAGLSLAQMDVIEINEAFAAQVLGCCAVLGLDPGDSRLNPRGGAIAVGHPLGASGARLVIGALNQLHAGAGRYACVSLCIGVGQGIAMVIERV